jgi:hypothetical protein
MTSIAVAREKYHHAKRERGHASPDESAAAQAAADKRERRRQRNLRNLEAQ